MPFPFIAPIKSEVKTKLENREKHGFDSHKLSPFAILSSGAVVTNQSTKILETIQSGDYDSNAYRGCVITNHSALNMMYQTSETKLGYDLNGKIIKVEGEVGRKISTPIIQSVEIDTDGGNNTLKSARIKVKVFSLKQLELFDLFFLRPSMPVVLEYGWNTDIISKTQIHSKLLSQKDHKTYVDEVVAHFSSFKESKIKYLEILKSTDYNFDYMVGKVTDFTYNPNEDGTYDIDLEISAGNELQLWMPIKQDRGKSESRTTVKDAKQYQTWLNKIYGDFNLPKVIENYPEADWKSEFFNWGMVNSQEKDKTVSFTQYISFKFVLELLNITSVFNSNEDKLLYYYEDKSAAIAKDKSKRLIPMNSHKFMCSTSDELIIPNAIPAFKRNTEKGKENELLLDTSGKLVDCSVNGKTFHIKSKTIYDADGNEYKLEEKDKVYGNLLNVFLRYDSVLSAFNNSFTQIEFINNVLAIVNNNTFGLCKLEIMSQTDDNTKASKSLSIIDYNLIALNPPKDEVKESYRFKIGPSSILKEFTFSMELGTLAQAQAMYQTQLNLNSIMKGEGFDKSVNSQQLETQNYKLFDLSYARNSDKYFSINEIEKKIVLAAASNARDKAKQGITNEQQKEETDTDKKPTDLADLIKSKSVKFKSVINNKSVVKTYIFLDKGVIQPIIGKEKTGSALTYLDIALAIDGISGFSCGEYFQIDGIPESYNRNGYFQITNVKQGIDDNGWKTTIEAGYRLDIEKAYSENE